MKPTVAVIGDGGWGTALALHLARAGHAVRVWSPFEADAERVRRTRRNERFLPGFDLPPDWVWTADRRAAAEGAKAMIWAVPSRYFRETARSFRPFRPDRALHVSATKGLDPQSLERMTQVAEAELGAGPVVALSGPTFAEEVARQLPTAAVAACRDRARAAAAQQLLGGEFFRMYTTSDVIGVEMGGALKNVIALAAGICDGIQAGLNARAALITRGLAEMTRLGVALGARAETFAGLSGMGDLVLTCTGALSRNSRVGRRIGAGERISDILEHMDQAVEGVTTCGPARDLARRLGVALPIMDEVFAVLFREKSPGEAARCLMGRTPRAEQDSRPSHKKES